MGQLLSGLKPFLRSENILFCERNGEKVGFLLWHPDYNLLFKKGGAPMDIPDFTRGEWNIRKPKDVVDLT